MDGCARMIVHEMQKVALMQIYIFIRPRLNSASYVYW